MDYQFIDQYMKNTGLAKDPAFEDLRFLLEPISQPHQDRTILGLYYPIGENDHVGYVPSSTIHLPFDASVSTLLHELGHRYGHYYYNNLTEEFAESYRKSHEAKEVPMKLITRVTKVCDACEESRLGKSRVCLFCEHGGNYARLGKTLPRLRVPQLAVTINSPISVYGSPAALGSTDFLFKATVTGIHPDNNQNYTVGDGEVKVQLWRNHWAILPDEKLAEVVAPAGGVVTLATINVYELTLFYIRAIHISTNNQATAYITCRPDGSYQFSW